MRRNVHATNFPHTHQPHMHTTYTYCLRFCIATYACLPPFSPQSLSSYPNQSQTTVKNNNNTYSTVHSNSHSPHLARAMDCPYTDTQGRIAFRKESIGTSNRALAAMGHRSRGCTSAAAAAAAAVVVDRIPVYTSS